MTYFSSDQHFWHQNILKYCPDRPWATVEEMNEALIQLHNETVSPEDTYYCLGDFAMAFRPVEVYTRRLNGKHKVLVLGNHDFAHKGHKKGKKDYEGWVKKYLDNGWDKVVMQDEIEINGQKVLLNHMPYKNLEPGEHGQNHAAFRPDDTGGFLLHGHVHQHWLKIGRMINVGVDAPGNEFKPLSLTRIVELMSIEGNL